LPCYVVEVFHWPDARNFLVPKTAQKKGTFFLSMAFAAKTRRVPPPAQVPETCYGNTGFMSRTLSLALKRRGKIFG
jgi:hypothetical protein